MGVLARASFKPLYLQISDFLREQIESGRLKPGDPILSERMIMAQFQVSRNTAQQAVEELAHCGLVTRVQGRGTFVADRKVRYGLQRLTSFSEEMRLKGMRPSSAVISLRQESPSELLVEKLRLLPEENIFRLERLRLADGQPMAHQVSFIPERLCPGLDRRDFSRESLFSVIEEDYGLSISWQEQTIKPVIASREEAALLQIKTGSPLLAAEGTAYLEDGTPIEYKRILWRSDLYEFTVQSSRRERSAGTLTGQGV